MGAYGQSDLRAGADVRFPFDLALQAARNAWRLAQELRSTAEEEKRRKADEGFQLGDIPGFFTERWGGQPDYGPTPPDPPVPTAPHFTTRHRPIHPEYGP